MGYEKHKASIYRKDNTYQLHVEGLGFIDPRQYVHNGFQVLQANSQELEALIAAGYESPRIRMRFS